MSPHPDDETLGAGGLIASQRQHALEVTVVAVTDGENAYLEGPSEAARLADVREREQEEALACLGVSRDHIVRLRLTDSGLARHRAELTERLLTMVDHETHVIAPWIGDFHPDHKVCGEAAAEAARRSGARLTWYFFWTWHRGEPAHLRELPLESFPLTDALLSSKTAALRCHASQLIRKDGQPILPEGLLSPARRNFEVFAAG